jgi:hypothetical protein
MNLEDLRARMRRLEDLSAGLAKEASLWQKCDAPVLYVDRLEYVEGIHEAIQGLEKARVALAKACRKIEESPS